MASKPNSGSQSQTSDNDNCSVNPPNSGLRTDFIGNSAAFAQFSEDVLDDRVILPSSSDALTLEATVENIDSCHVSPVLPACSPSHTPTAQTQQDTPINAGPSFDAGPFQNMGNFRFMFEQFAQAMTQGFRSACSADNTVTNNEAQRNAQHSSPSTATHDDNSFGASLDTIVQDAEPTVAAEVTARKDEDSDLLAELSEHFAQEEQVGNKISDVLAQAIVPVFRSKISKEKRKSLLELYNRPANCDTIKTPRINKSIWNNMSRSARDADVSSQIVQSSVCSLSYPLLHLTDKLYTAKANKRPIYGSDLQECLKLATDTFKLVQMLHSDLTSRRRAAIQPQLNQAYRDLCSPDTPVTDMLFGDDLDRRIKDLTDAQNITKKLTNRSSGHGGYRGRQLRPNNRVTTFGHNSRTNPSSGQYTGSRNPAGDSYRFPQRQHPYAAQNRHQHYNKRTNDAHPAHKTATVPFLGKHQAKTKQKS